MSPAHHGHQGREALGKGHTIRSSPSLVPGLRELKCMVKGGLPGRPNDS